MNEKEYYSTIDTMLNDVSAIIHNQLVYAGIHDELEVNRLRPYEQDFIYRDHFDAFPGQPKTHTLHGVKITSRVLHQTGIRLSDIRGADMLYEVEREKFVLIQYKRADNQLIKNDKEQLDRLLGNCPENCKNIGKRPFPATYVPLKTFAFCGIWYRVINGFEITNVTACEAESIFQGKSSQPYSSFQKGLSQYTFNELFASCRIGALLKKPVVGNSKEILIHKLMDAGHFIFNILQAGFWRGK